VADIAIRDLTKHYPNGFEAVRGVDLDVTDGELLVLVGPSGCGKSTLLRMIAGLEEATAGTIAIDGRDVTRLPPKDRDIAMVFQSYALYPHMTVRRNIGYPLRLARIPKPELDRRVLEAANLLQLEDVLDRRPSQLSGGQRQRVAMGRAIVREPRAFLMDEPLSNLDAKLRVEMRAEIARLQQELAVTTVYVTHDQVEAMTMGTRVAVLDQGRLQQIDSPTQLYAWPRNLFVATFIGSPAMNVFEARLDVEPDGALAVAFGEHRVPLDPAVVAANPELRDRVGAPIVVGVRPEDFDDVALDPGVPAERVIEVPVYLVEALGSEMVVHAAIAPSPGDPAGRARGVVRLSPRSRVERGDTIKLAIDTRNIHLFDPATGESLRSPA